MSNDIEHQMLLASRRMVILEELDGKSDDYIRGFFRGFKLGEDYVVESLSPKVAELEESINKLRLQSMR